MAGSSAELTTENSLEGEDSTGPAVAKNGRGSERITLDRIIALLASVSALATALVAMLTLLEMQKQRRVSLKPDVVPAEFVEVELEVAFKKWFDVTAIVGGRKINRMDRIPISVHNFGLGPAKNLKLLWTYDAAKYVDLLETLDRSQEFVFEIKNGILDISHSSGTRIAMSLRPSVIDFAPDYTVSIRQYEFYFPMQFVYLLGVDACLSSKK